MFGGNKSPQKDISVAHESGIYCIDAVGIWEEEVFNQLGFMELG